MSIRTLGLGGSPVVGEMPAADDEVQTALVPSRGIPTALSQAAAAADRAASSALFAEYHRQLAAHTRSAHDQDLARCALYLADVGVAVGALAAEPAAWSGFTWGLVEGFKRWMLREGYALATLNRTLATVRSYVRLAAQAGAVPAEQATLIAAVKGYGRKQGRNLDADRPVSRRGVKKAQAVALSLAHARALKDQPTDTPQGRRDALLICLLLDHGLRVGEIAALTVGAISLDAGTLTFYHEKVDLTQTHLLTPTTLRAALAYLSNELAEAISSAPLLRGSRKSGALHGAMGLRSMQARVRLLGEAVGLKGLSPHDCRHWWASAAIAGGTDLLALQEAGGWASLAMPRRYVERARIANERVKLQT
ncbi:MAG: site-specific integrase [Chloroflexales bacterium]|nr:site-specific integrase [Chloroflexales bacterium]